LRDLIIIGAVKENASHVLRDFPEDQLDRMRNQANIIGAATLIRAADITSSGLTEMRGATAPRLTLELICGRILLPSGDDSAVIARLERLERGINPGTSSAPVAAPVAVKKEEIKKEVVIEEVKVEPKAVEEKVEAPTPIRAAPAAPSTNQPTGPVDVAALRRLWPEVIENVKKRRRLTWSLLAASAQVLAIDEKSITIAIVNAGARDSFMRSGSDEILKAAFEDVIGLKHEIEVIVDSSIGIPTSERTTEEHSDENQLSGTALLARELGAQVIKEFEQ
jgi:DNA polymerase III subunit gamma/tau